MSVQDPIVFADENSNADIHQNSVWRYVLLVSIVCSGIVFGWSAQIINVGQIIAITALLSVGLSVRSLMKLEAVDSNGISESVPAVETAFGAVVVAALGAVSLILASSILGPFSGVLQSFAFVATAIAIFVAAMAVETLISLFACFALKPLVSSSAIGAEIAMMLNLQQKYRTQLV